MSISPDFVQSIKFLHTEEFLTLLQQEDRPQFNTSWIVTNEISPVDLYCYLGARFGRPNGYQNYLRSDTTDNLIHWEWVLRTQTGFIILQGLNYRTEIWLSDPTVNETDRELFIQELQKDILLKSAEVNEIRNLLEHWVEFVNPYQRLRRCITILLADLEKLGVNPKQDSIPDLHELAKPDEFENIWKEQTDKYS